MGDPLSNYGWFDDLARRSKPEVKTEGPIVPSERRGTIAALSGLFRISGSLPNSGPLTGGIQGLPGTSSASGANQMENLPTLSTAPTPTTSQNTLETTDSSTSKYRTHRSFSLF